VLKHQQMTVGSVGLECQTFLNLPNSTVAHRQPHPSVLRQPRTKTVELGTLKNAYAGCHTNAIYIFKKISHIYVLDKSYNDS